MYKYTHIYMYIYIYIIIHIRPFNLNTNMHVGATTDVFSLAGVPLFVVKIFLQVCI
jgi:hypothetical protein